MRDVDCGCKDLHVLSAMVSEHAHLLNVQNKFSCYRYISHEGFRPQKIGCAMIGKVLITDMPVGQLHQCVERHQWQRELHSKYHAKAAFWKGGCPTPIVEFSE